MTLPEGEEKPLRILMVLSGYPPAAKAGMENACKRLSEALARRGHRVLVLTQAHANLPAIADENGVTVYRVIKPRAVGPLWGVTYMSQMRRWMKRLSTEWDVVMCHQLYLHACVAQEVARALGKMSVTRLVNTGELSDIRQLRDHHFGERLVRSALRCDHFFALSNVSAKELQLEGIEAARIWRYRNFIDVEKFSPGAPPTGKALLYLGRFTKQKNIPALVRAFAEVPGNRTRLLLVGDGRDSNDVREAVNASAARERIEIRGWCDKPVAAFREAYAYVTATETEGMSNVLVEALACGTPVIATDISGVRDALDPRGEAPSFVPRGEFWEGAGGLIVPSGDEAALAHAMTTILNDKERRDKLAKEARWRAETHYSEDSSVADFVRMIRLMINKAPASDAERGFAPGLFESS